MTGERLIAAWPHSDGEIRVQLVSFRDKPRADIRLYWNDKKSGEWRPTRKGVSLPVDDLDKLRAALEELAGIA